MPAYQNVTPPSSLFSGDVGFSFNNEAFPGSATSGTQFALPSFTGTNDPGTAVRWQTIFGTAPSAVNIVLQGAMADVDSEYQTIDTSQLEVDLLSSTDDKIVQRELAYLRELRYGKRAPSTDDEPLPIIFDAPRPERDMP